MNTKTNYQLIKTEPENLPKVREILESCGLPSHDLTKEQMQHFFMVKSDTNILGTVGLEVYGESGLLRSLAVRKNKQGKGLGKLLVRQIESYARDLGISKMYLLTTTADQFFQHLGYDKVSREEVPDLVLQSDEFSQICPSSAVSMMKAICQPG